MQHHKYGYEDLMNMLPWERTIYAALLVQWLKEEEERRKAEARR
jgi:hypothetical protein